MDYQKTSIVGIDSLQLLASQKTLPSTSETITEAKCHSLAIMQDIQKQRSSRIHHGSNFFQKLLLKN